VLTPNPGIFFRKFLIELGSAGDFFRTKIMRIGFAVPVLTLLSMYPLARGPRGPTWALAASSS